MNLEIWNKAAVVNLLQDIAHKPDKLWVRWLHSYYIKKQDLWQVAAPSNCSWMTKKILNSKIVVDACGGQSCICKAGKVVINKVYESLQPSADKVQ